MFYKAIRSFALVLILASILSAQNEKKYAPEWASLDARPNPEWYLDAKLGIFIHWGVYSVPAWRPKGSYAEWYWRALADRHDSTWVWHERNWGKNFNYQDFARYFKAELFDPDQWADLFKRAGAKYVVLTSKHHDGFALWPSEHSWNWNSVDIGPHRDLLGDLTDAVRKTGVRMGFYYSLLEWFNPLYNNDIHRFVEEYTLPQFKDAVNRYKPDIIFSDGEWDHPSKTWRSEEFLAWLYNESNAPKDVVVNDRWGSETRFKHGGYYSTEYDNIHGEIGENLITRGWEECRGLGASFGYNRHEDISDYVTAKDLAHMFIEIISKGGNLLLNVGPTADGRIPVIMQERLLQLGEWISANQEAVYGTRASHAFGEGDHVRFTRSKDGKFVYAIVLKRPFGTLNLSLVHPKPDSKITMLGGNHAFDWRINDERLEVKIPAEISNNLPEAFGYTFKIEAAPHVEKAEILAKDVVFIDRPEGVRIETKTHDAAVHYTLDGSEPSRSSARYQEPIVLKNSARLRVRAFKDGHSPSVIATKDFSIVNSEENGLSFQYFEGAWRELPDFSKLRPAKSGQAYAFDIDAIDRREEEFGVVFKGFVEIEKAGEYTFFINSDDGSKLFLNGDLLIDNDGLHGDQEKGAKIQLSSGRHAIEAQMFEAGGGQALGISYEGPNIPKQSIPPHRLFRNEQ